MLAIERVRKIVSRLGPVGICDECLAVAAALDSRTEARRHARELLGSDRFERQNCRCGMCNAARVLTRRSR